MIKKISILIFMAFCYLNIDINNVYAKKKNSIMSKGNDCSFYTANDNFLLALSWQEAFCVSQKTSKSECEALKNGELVLSGFTLHGLWPSSKRCNTSFCAAKKMHNFCDYQPLDLIEKVSNELKEVMPSFQYNSCLERHEWNKHGTCSLLDEDQYFDLAVDFVKEFNDSEFNKFIVEHKGKTLMLQEIRDKFVEVFHVKNPNYIGFRCDRDGNNNLTEIQMPLPSKLKKGDSLYDLIPKIDNNGNTSCSGSKPINVIA